MKTAEEWRQSSALFRNALWSPEGIDEILKQIQLDSFKAGMSEAALVIHNRELREAGIPIDSNQLTRGEKSILAARDAKTEL
jgi:hypothetical protein